jgi:hypothetical protein
MSHGALTASQRSMWRKNRTSNEPIVECVRKQATITKLLTNPDLVEMEIHMTWEEIRRLCCQYACMVLLKARQDDGAVVPEGI